MKVLITGASGFIGSFLLKQLIKEGKHEVAVILRDPLNAWRIHSCLKNVYLIEGSLDDPNSYLDGGHHNPQNCLCFVVHPILKP